MITPYTSSNTQTTAAWIKLPDFGIRRSNNYNDLYRGHYLKTGYYACSICLEVENAEKNFCPHCGAYMLKGEDNNDQRRNHRIF